MFEAVEMKLFNSVPLVFVCRNICHGSDSVESAEREIKLWFKDEELIAWTPAAKDWIYE